MSKNEREPIGSLSINGESHEEISVIGQVALNFYLFASDIGRDKVRGPNDPISANENINSTTFILLQSAYLEAYVNRLIYLLKIKGVDDASMIDKVQSIIGYQSPLFCRWKEINVIRNAIAHCHLYVTKRSMDRKIINAEAKILKKNRDWKECVDQQNNFRTHILKLHAIPSEVNFEDCHKFLSFWVQFYEEVNTKYDKKYGYLPSEYPWLYLAHHKNDKSLKEKVDEHVGTDGSLKKWLDFSR